MNILITGGAGYIGTELIYSLEADDLVDRIVVYDSLFQSNFNLFLGRSKLKTNKVHFVQGDILDSRKLKKQVDNADVVYHLAAKVTTPFADHNPHEFDQINNWGTAELSYLVQKSKVKKFIYTSSASVYGASQEEMDVTSPLNPKTFYGISKMHGEEHVNGLRGSDIKVYVLRLGNVFGYSKSMRFDSVINKFMFEANFTKRLRINGDGDQWRSFIHIDRLTTILKNIAMTDLKPDIYNLVTNSLKINAIVDELRSLYPGLEMIFVNQNMKMRSLRVKPDERIPEVRSLDIKSLAVQMSEFKDQFSF
jgi:UDP-glucose 4-epimerase|tara:strand:+ start:6674 stop:7594 length:921 start_codon:yes stop_codon:yes gene_type:complete